MIDLTVYLGACIPLWVWLIVCVLYFIDLNYYYYWRLSLVFVIKARHCQLVFSTCQLQHYTLMLQECDN